MKFFKCENFESLSYTRNRLYQDRDNMTFMYSDIPGINVSHCYMSAPKNKEFFNLDVFPSLRSHTQGIHELLSTQDRRTFSRLLLKYSGRSLEKFGLGLYGSNQIHIFVQSSIVSRVAEYFFLQETMLGDLAFCCEWNDVNTQLQQKIGTVDNEDPLIFQEVLLSLESSNDWHEVIHESDYLFLVGWLENCIPRNGEVRAVDIFALKILRRLKWLWFYCYLVGPHLVMENKGKLSSEYFELVHELRFEFESMYPFLNWEFPLVVRK